MVIALIIVILVVAVVVVVLMYQRVTQLGATKKRKLFL
jgi:hypothetical protein